MAGCNQSYRAKQGGAKGAVGVDGKGRERVKKVQTEAEKKRAGKPSGIPQR